MTTVHARQIQLTKMHIRKTTPSEESTVYFLIFSHYIAHTLFTPLLRFSPLYHPYIPFPVIGIFQ